MKLLRTSNFTYIKEFNAEELSIARLILLLEVQDYNKNTVKEEFLFFENSQFFFYTGLLKFFSEKILESGVYLEIINQWEEKSFNFEFEPDFLNNITLREDQVWTIKRCLSETRGIVDLPTRTGKTEIFCGVVKLYQENVSDKNKIIIIEDRINLMLQTAERLRLRGVENVGCLGAGLKETESQVIVCTIDTLYSNFQKNADFFNEVFVVIVDEMHHLAAESYKKIVSSFEHLDLLLGFSGTPLENESNPYLNSRDMTIIGCLHKVIVKISTKFFIDRKIISEPNVFFLNYESVPSPFFAQNYNLVYNRFIVNNKNRNRSAVNIINYCKPKNLSILISIRVIAHGKILLKMLSDIEDVVFSYGDNTNVSVFSEYYLNKYPNCIKEVKYDKEFDGDLIFYNDNFNVEEEINKKGITTLIGSSVFDEGRDIPNLDGVILLAGGSSHVTTIQRPARSLTRSATRTKSFIIDYLDHVHPFLKNHSKIRRELYLKNYYKIFDGSHEFAKFLNQV